MEKYTSFVLSEDRFKYLKKGQVWVIREIEYNMDIQKTCVGMTRVDFAQ